MYSNPDRMQFIYVLNGQKINQQDSKSGALLSTSMFIKVFIQFTLPSQKHVWKSPTIVKMFSGSKDLKNSNYTELETFLDTLRRLVKFISLGLAV